MINRSKLSYKALKTYIIKTNDYKVDMFVYNYKKNVKVGIKINLKQNLTGFIEITNTTSSKRLNYKDGKLDG